MAGTVLQDLLNEDISTNPPRVTVQQVYDFIASSGIPAKNLGNAFNTPKTLVQFYDMVRRAILDYEGREGTTEINRIHFTEEEPDQDSQTESIVFSLLSRKPGQFAQGAPNSRKHTNQRPIIRGVADDTTYPTYKKLIYGYYYDNNVRFTCWARTNKAANARADWFESLMEEYSWWFKLQGMDRVLYQGRDADIVTTKNENKWYGRPIDFFVRTEKLWVFREKALEEIIINLSVDEDDV